MTSAVLREYIQTILFEGKWEDVRARADAKGLGAYSRGFTDYKAEGINPKFAELAWKHFTYGGGSPLPPARAIKQLFERFEELTKIKPEGFEPDITKYETFQDLSSRLMQFADVVSKSKEKEGATKGTNRVFEDKDWVLMEVHTKEAACHYGKGTQWCISATKADNWFDRYYGKFSDFWFLTHKPSNTKWAIVHTPNGKVQVFDAQDTEISLSGMQESIEGLLKGVPAPVELAAALERVAGLTVNDRVVANPGRVLTSMGPRLDSETLIKLALRVQASPEKFSPENLTSLLLRISRISKQEYKSLLDTQTLTQLQEFLRTTPFSDPDLADYILNDLDDVEIQVGLKDPNLPDEEFRKGLQGVPSNEYYYLPRSIIPRVADLLSRAPTRNEREETGLWRLLKDGHLDPTSIPPETYLRLADTTKFPYDFREAVASTLIPWLKGSENELLHQILGGSVKVEEFMARAPNVEAGWQGLGHSQLPEWELARDLQANGMDPIRVALKRITESLGS